MTWTILYPGRQSCQGDPGKEEMQLVPSWAWYLAFYLTWLHKPNATQTPVLATLDVFQHPVGGTIFLDPASVEDIGIPGPLGHLYPGKDKTKLLTHWINLMKTCHPVETILISWQETIPPNHSQSGSKSMVCPSGRHSCNPPWGPPWVLLQAPQAWGKVAFWPVVGFWPLEPWLLGPVFWK